MWDPRHIFVGTKTEFVTYQLQQKENPSFAGAV